MRTRYFVCGLLLAIGCGTNSNPVQKPLVATSEHTPRPDIVELPPIEVEEGPAQVKEDPGVVTDVTLPTPVNGSKKSYTLGKRCTFVDDQCVPSTIVLTLDGKVLSFKGDSAPAAPFGQWDKIQVSTTNSGEPGMYLSLQHKNDYQHLRFEIDNGAMSETGSERFPRGISKTIPNTIDFDGDGKPEKMHFTCNAARLATERPTACAGKFNLWIGRRKVYTNYNTYAETDDITVMPFTHKSVNAIRITSTQDEGSWTPPSLTIILASKAGVINVAFSDTLYGKATWSDTAVLLSKKRYATNLRG